MKIAALILAAILLMLAGCGDDPHPPQRHHPPPPAEAEAQELAAREHAARIEAATTSDPLVRTRATDLADALAKLRVDAETRAVAQREEIDRRAAEAQRAADDRATRQQAAADRRWALIAAASASALAVGAGLVLGYLGQPRLAVALPVIVAATCGVGIGILSAGPLLAWILGGLAMLAAIAGAIAGIRALRRDLGAHQTALAHAVDYGERVAELAGEQYAGGVEVIRDRAKAIAKQVGCGPTITAAIRRHRAETAVHQAIG